jgi:hypothetical protein
VCLQIVKIGGCKLLRFRGGFGGSIVSKGIGISVSFSRVLWLNVHYKFRIQMVVELIG